MFYTLTLKEARDSWRTFPTLHAEYDDFETYVKAIGAYDRPGAGAAPPGSPAATPLRAHNTAGGDFEAKVKTLVDSGLTRGQAIRAVVKEHPDLHERWLQEHNNACR